VLPLLGDRRAFLLLGAGSSAADVVASYSSDLAEFEDHRRAFLLY
jgi:hypothetical protein